MLPRLDWTSLCLVSDHSEYTVVKPQRRLQRQKSAYLFLQPRNSKVIAQFYHQEWIMCVLRSSICRIFIGVLNSCKQIGLKMYSASRQYTDGNNICHSKEQNSQSTLQKDSKRMHSTGESQGHCDTRAKSKCVVY